MKRSYTLRSVTEADIDWLIELRINEMGGYLNAAGEFLSMDDQRARVMYEFEKIQIILNGTDPIGMLKVVKSANEWHLVQVQLASSYQNKGLGGLIVQKLINDAAKASVPLELSVLRVNPAKKLYERLGFTVVSETSRAFEMRINPL